MKNINIFKTTTIFTTTKKKIFIICEPFNVLELFIDIHQ